MSNCLVAPSTASDSPRLLGTAPTGVLADRFKIERLIGTGSFGWVLAAQDLSARPPRDVALKVLRAERPDYENALIRMQRRELKVLQLVHDRRRVPNVVRSLEPSIQTDNEGRHFIVLELIDGPSLSERLAAIGCPPVAESKNIGLGIARGLARVHAIGAIHRDLKPSNIRLRTNVDPVIVDFGLARALWVTEELTGEGVALMTPRYAAPEQLAGERVTSAADVYAFGLILYEMLAGSVPLQGGSTKDLCRIRASLTPLDLRAWHSSIPSEIAELVLCCLEPNPSRRLTAQELVSILGRPQVRRRLFLGGISSLFAAGAIGAVENLLLDNSERKNTPSFAKKIASAAHEFLPAAGHRFITTSPEDERCDRLPEQSMVTSKIEWRHQPKLLVNDSATQIATGSRSALVMLIDGTIRVWPDPYLGTLWRDANPFQMTTSIQMACPSAIKDGPHEPSIISADGRAYTLSTSFEPTPMRYAPEMRSISEWTDVIAATYDPNQQTTLLIRRDGSVWMVDNYESTEQQAKAVVLSGVFDATSIVRMTNGVNILCTSGTVWESIIDVRSADYDSFMRALPRRIIISRLRRIEYLQKGSSIRMIVHPFVLDEHGVLWKVFPQSSIGTLPPERVPGLPRIRTISGRDDAMLAIDIWGEVWAWGRFSPEVKSDVPFKVSGFKDVVAVSIGSTCCMALTEHGSVWAWGTENYCDQWPMSTGFTGCHDEY